MNTESEMIQYDRLILSPSALGSEYVGCVSWKSVVSVILPSRPGASSSLSRGVTDISTVESGEAK